MSLGEAVFARAVQMTDQADSRQMDLLRLLCNAAASSLASRLRDGLAPEDCLEDFILAASLYALADLDAVAENVQVEEFKAGDLTVKEGDTISLGEKSYLFRRVEFYYYGNQAVYLWGLCVEKGVNDTWGTQS